MEHIDLEHGLALPLCLSCRIGRIRPINITGKSLWFNCTRCRCSAMAELPEIRKMIIYLDTSTVWHIASALRRGSESARGWLRLYQVLRQGAADDVLCCVCSSVLRREAELSPIAPEIMEIAEALGDCDPRHELDVRHSQLFRALGRYLAGAAPICETSPPWEDAFDTDPHRWCELFRINLAHRQPPQAELEARRLTKASAGNHVTWVYERYATEELSFDSIRRLEVQGYGRGLLTEGISVIKSRVMAAASRTSSGPLSDLLPTTLDLIVSHIECCLRIGHAEAFQRAIQFLSSDHVSMTPIADIGARLIAALAIEARGPMARKRSDSDAGDIDHVATFLPYVDVIIVDRFVASLCNRSDRHLGDAYGTEICSLGEKEIDGFAKMIDGVRAQCKHLDLVNRVHKAIEKGGYIQERAAAMGQWLNQRKDRGK